MNQKLLFPFHATYFIFLPNEWRRSLSIYLCLWNFLLSSNSEVKRSAYPYTFQYCICMYLLTKVESGLLQTDPAHRWSFSLTFLKKNPNKNVNNGTLQEREQAKIGDVRKRNSKLSGKSSSTELGQFVLNLTSVWPKVALKSQSGSVRVPCSAKKFLRQA